MNGPVIGFLRSAGFDGAVEELRDVVGELLRILFEEAVVRVAVDSERGVWEVLGEQAAVLRVQHLVVVTVGHKRGLRGAGQAVELRGVGDPQAVIAVSCEGVNRCSRVGRGETI